MKTFRECKCGRKHVQLETFMRCKLPHAQVVGKVRGKEGWATLSRCGKRWSVYVWANVDRALEALSQIDRFACGSGCKRDHELFEVKV